MDNNSFSFSIFSANEPPDGSLTNDNLEGESDSEASTQIADEKFDSRRFGTIPEHVEFIKMLREAKQQADESEEKVNVTWRGYKTSVLAGLPPFTVKALRDRLIWALRGIYNIRTSEREVNNYLIHNILK